MKLRRVLCGAALWGVLGWAIFCVCVICLAFLPGCEQKPQKPQLGDVRYKDGQLQVRRACFVHETGCEKWQCFIDATERNFNVDRRESRIDTLVERTESLERQLACLEAGGHKYEITGFWDKLHNGLSRSALVAVKAAGGRIYIFTCSGCDKEYKRGKCNFGPVEKAAMREFCGESEERAE